MWISYNKTDSCYWLISQFKSMRDNNNLNDTFIIFRRGNKIELVAESKTLKKEEDLIEEILISR